MSSVDLELRVAALEREIQQLRATVAAKPAEKNWRRTVGIFGNDPVMKRIMKEALRIRDENRKATRRPKSKAKRREK